MEMSRRGTEADAIREAIESAREMAEIERARHGAKVALRDGSTLYVVADYMTRRVTRKVLPGWPTSGHIFCSDYVYRQLA